MRIIPDAKRIFRKAWSIRLALLIGALNGLYGAFDALQAFIPPVAFVSINMVLSMACIGSRLIYQKGAHDEQD